MIEEPPKYSSMLPLINLPPKRPLHPTSQTLFQASEQLQPLTIPASLRNTRHTLVSQIHNQLQIYTDTKYDFRLPGSKFPDVPEGQRNNISYQEKVVHEDEDTFKPKLSQEQLEQIRETGEFEVRSMMRNVSIPYVWKINDCIFRGRANVLAIWQKGLCFCYELLCKAGTLVAEVVPANVVNLGYLPVRLFALLFGKKTLTQIHAPDYAKEVQMDFWADVLKNELQDIRNELGHEFLEEIYLRYEPALYENPEKTQAMTEEEYLDLKKIKDNKIDTYNKSKAKIDGLLQTLINVETAFQGDWLKIRKRLLLKVSSQVEDNSQKVVVGSDDESLQKQLLSNKDQLVVKRFHEQKFLIYTAHLRQHLPKHVQKPTAAEALIQLVLIINLISVKMRLRDKKINSVRQGIQVRIVKQNPIRSQRYQFLNQRVQEQMKTAQQKVQLQFHEDLLKQIMVLTKNNQIYHKIYMKYLAYRANFSTLLAQKQSQSKTLYRPTRTFYSTYLLLPPYQTIRDPRSKNYSLVKQHSLQIDTGSHFWKSKLYWMRLKSWTINCVVALLGLAWVGPFGFRCLFGLNDFEYDEHLINNATGEKRKQKRSTFLGTFRTVLEGISNSRQTFQNLPDRGLFGKNCSRIFNFIECYLFRFLFVGIIGCLILYPILIITLSSVCLVLVLTVWLWIPLAMLLVYLFNILVFQFEISRIPDGCLIRSFPLISLIVYVVLCLVKIIGSLLVLLVLAPLAVVLCMLFFILQRVFRTLTDTVMLCFIRCLGRTPSTDSSIARKISGPGMSRSYYFSIAEADVYVLTQAELQKLYMNKFVQLTRRQIESTAQKYYTIMDYVLKPFKLGRHNVNSGYNIVEKNRSELLEHFQKKVTNYMARYPGRPYNVRFTQEEIDKYFDNSVKIVKNFVERERIEDWIFDEHQILRLDYDQLTRHVWCQTFNCGQAIFEPLEAIDVRFKLVDQPSNEDNELTSSSFAMKKSVNQVMRALQGQVQLTTRNISLNPAKQGLLAHDCQLDCLRRVSELHVGNSELRVRLEAADPGWLFVAPRDVAEARRYGEWYVGELYRKEQRVMTK